MEEAAFKGSLFKCLGQGGRREHGPRLRLVYTCLLKSFHSQYQQNYLLFILCTFKLSSSYYVCYYTGILLPLVTKDFSTMLVIIVGRDILFYLSQKCGEYRKTLITCSTIKYLLEFLNKFSFNFSHFSSKSHRPSTTLKPNALDDT